jgi:CHAD domain-containing protein
LVSKLTSENALALLKDQPATALDRAQHVVAVCESLFAHAKHLHGLTKTSLKLLRLAAVIRQTAPSPENFLNAARELLTADQWRIVRQAVEFDPSQLNGRVRIGRFPQGKDAASSGVAVRIAAIVRIAEALDASGGPDIDLVGIRDDGQTVVLCVSGGSSARRNAAAAARKADWWNRVALRPIRSVVVVTRPCAGLMSIGPQENMAETGRRILLRQLEQMVSRQYGLPYHEDAEYVHEMRVAIRRLRAAIGVFRKGFADGLKAENEQLRTLADALGAARDADVFIEFIRGYLKTCPRKIRPLLAGLLACQKRLRGRHHRQLLGLFQTEDQARFLRRLYQRLQRPVGAQGGLVPARGKRADGAGERARKMLRRRMKQVIAFGRRLDLLSSDEQHQLRIACKKLRYTAEFFTGLCPSSLQRLVNVMTRMQDLLGMSHDADVYSARLEKYSLKRYGEHPGSRAAAALRTTRNRLRRIRRECLRKASVVWKSFTASRSLGEWKKSIASLSAR